jgi:predicted MFS family arabinose efflux permease
VSVAAGPATTSRRHRLRTAALIPTLVLVTMVTATVSSLGAPLVPEIAATRGVGVPTAQLSLTVALLVGAVATPVLGRFGGSSRRKPVILVALVLVAVGCAVAALPLAFGWLLAGRALQGIGLALNPLAFAAVRDSVDEERAPTVIAVLAAVTVAGGGLGYLATGLIAEWAGLSMTFWVGLIVCLVTLVLVALVVPGPQDRSEGERVDWSSAALLGTGTAGILVTLSLGATWGWASLPTLACTGVGVVTTVLWFRRSRRVAHPLVDLSLAARPGAFGAHLTAFTVGTGMYVVFTTTQLVAQAPPSTGFGLGYSVAVAGSLLLPYAVFSAGGTRLALALGHRLSPDGVLAVGCCVLVAGAVFLVVLHHDLWHLLVGSAFFGLGGGCTFSAMPGILVRAVPAEETSSSIGFNLVLRYLGFSTGSALGAAVLAAASPGTAITASAVRVTLVVGMLIWTVAGTAALVLARRSPLAATKDAGVVVQPDSVP